MWLYKHIHIHIFLPQIIWEQVTDRILLQILMCLGKNKDIPLYNYSINSLKVNINTIIQSTEFIQILPVSIMSFSNNNNKSFLLQDPNWNHLLHVNVSFWRSSSLFLVFHALTIFAEYRPFCTVPLYWIRLMFPHDRFKLCTFRRNPIDVCLLRRHMMSICSITSDVNSWSFKMSARFFFCKVIIFFSSWNSLLSLRRCKYSDFH